MNKACSREWLRPRKLGGLDVAVNNAGVGVIGLQENFKVEDW